jgi:hypothetical protein
MKKVLIIGHFWPYREGSGRVLGLAKHLSEFGWQPIILTAPLYETPDPQFRVIQTPCPHFLGFGAELFGLNQRENTGVQLKERLNVPENSFRKSFLAFFYNVGRAIICYPDLYKRWKPFAVKAGSELLQKEDIDAMISIWPVTSHLIAKELKNKHKIPWVADFPDLWSQNHNYHYGHIRQFFDRRLELKTVSSADALTTVSQPWVENLKMLHKRKSVYAITPGFDPDTLNMPPADLTAKYTITYTGAIYTGKQDPSKLFAALRDLISDGTMDPNDIEVRFYGHEVKWLASEIEEYGLSAIAKHYGIVPMETAFGKQRESQLLLLLNWDDYRIKGWHSLKIYAYLAAQRPILATGGSGDDVVKELLDETNAGTYAPSVEDIKSILKEMYLEYKLKGKISYKGDLEKINKYSHREMARKFAEILDSQIQQDQKVDRSEKEVL